MNHIAIDDYVVDVLLPDLCGHDRSPAAFLVYVVLWTRLFRSAEQTTRISLQSLAAQTGLSKSSVQAGIRLLLRRGLIKAAKASPTAIPQYALVRHWLRRRATAHAANRQFHRMG
jgi:hypothetical protein